MFTELAYQTPPEWARRVGREPLALLADHAHCELKAAASAQAMIGKNPEHTALVEQLSEVAIEELEHFRAVHAELRARGGELTTQEVNPYVEALLRESATTRSHLLLDRLLIAHLIEARSLERFHLLGEHLEDEGLALLYRELLPSEASHRTLFLRLAREIYPERAEARSVELRQLEGRIVAGLPFAFRVHSGLGDSAR